MAFLPKFKTHSDVEDERVDLEIPGSNEIEARGQDEFSLLLKRVRFERLKIQECPDWLARSKSVHAEGDPDRPDA